MLNRHLHCGRVISRQLGMGALSVVSLSLKQPTNYSAASDQLFLVCLVRSRQPVQTISCQGSKRGFLSFEHWELMTSTAFQSMMHLL